MCFIDSAGERKREVFAPQGFDGTCSAEAFSIFISSVLLKRQEMGKGKRYKKSSRKRVIFSFFIRVTDEGGERREPRDVGSAQGGYGLLWYGDELWYQYMKYNCNTKLSTYLAAGIPVIVPHGISNQYLVEENNLGLVVDSLDEAVEQVQNITEQQYLEYVHHVRGFAELLRNGYFTRKLLTESIHLIYRKSI